MSDDLRITATQNEDVRSLQQMLTTGCKDIAAYAEHAAVPVVVTVLGRAGSRVVVDGPLMTATRLAANPESLLLTLGPGVRVSAVSGDAS